MAAKLKACQEIMPPPHQQHQQQQPPRRKQPYGSIGIQKSASSSLKSLNGSLNASRISVGNDLDENDTSHRKTTAI